MEFYDVINARFSCKKFKNKPISTETLELILRAGNLAPTAKNLQEHKIYVLTSESLLRKVDNITPCRYNAPVVMAIVYDKDNTFLYPGGKHNSGIEDVSIVATYIMLAATNENINSCWINYFDPEKASDELNLPDNEKLVLMLALGYRADDFTITSKHYIRKDISENVVYLR